ncbi:MAG: 2-oxoglutarate dehydrogenase E1 component [Thermoleophilia bacterium]|nr:2-oxoglutarate dehydrogenase E1 component [Thermoleophilia bacterium]
MSQQPVDAVNLGYVRELLDRYLAAPGSVDADWRRLFGETGNGIVGGHPLIRRLRELRPELAAGTAPPPPAADAELLGGVAAAMALVKAHRMHGHLAARLDPLGSEPPGDPALEPERLTPPLTPALRARIPASVLRVAVPGATLAEALPHLRQTYCGTLAYEIEHISSHEQRVWLRHAIESSAYRRQLAPAEQRHLLGRLAEVEGFERYLRRTFLGQKQFSIEGVDALVPMLDEVLELAAAGGARTAVIGMAHRGRLSVLAHTVGRPYEQVLREFEGERVLDAVALGAEEGTGDVKYHQGAEGGRATPAGEIAIVLAANPSHLEAVDPVVEGITRALQTDPGMPAGDHDPRVALAILIHGDAAFAGEGVVAETFNLQALEGYATGGTLHLIANNQIGFTTDPEEGRSTRYSSDLAKGFDCPIVHVNADDPEAALAAIRLAMAFRERFRHDVVVDLVGYRRFGHNEQDEPMYTQPLAVRAIEQHPTVRQLYGARLAAAGVVGEHEDERLVEAVEQRVRQAHETLRATGFVRPEEPRLQRLRATPQDTGVRPETLLRVNEELVRVPAGFNVHPKLARQLERRLETVGPDGGIDWGQAEALAFASLALEGVPVRLTGQDTERGTFSHRHLVLHDVETGAVHTPSQHLTGARAAIEVHNSPLSELAALGFEYGFSVAVPNGLVLWEAQFGDFVNAAQVVVDQFIVSGFAKWGQTSRLTLLLPHGYEGNGPEHSSARVERFLQLAAQGNVRIANCSTPAQYFHLLRLQALGSTPRPLVLFTPKSLLRSRAASSRLDELTSGWFRPVFDDPALGPAERERVRRLLLCTGKVYYDIVGHPVRAEAEELAVARLEQLYPFPVPAYVELLAAYPRLEELVWVQEEPQNMGAFRSLRHRLEDSLPPGVVLRFAGRPWRASTSEAYPTAHLVEQDRLVRAALGATA